LLLLPLLPGCGNNDIQVYRAPKEQTAAQNRSQPAGLPPGHPGTGSAAPPSLKWILPAGWEEIPAGEMRLASFRVKGQGAGQADVGIVPLPGIAGSDLDNVNRWRSQVGQPPVSEAELPQLAQAIEITGQPGQLYDQAGQNPASGDKTRILAAVLRRDGIAWFFKMNGDDALVAQQKPNFIAFLKSLTFAAPSPELPPSHPPIGDAATPAGQGATAAPGASDGKPTWQVPNGWQEGSAGPFLVAKFSVAGADNAKADINVSMSAGEGGGVAGNVNRWRGQLGLGPLDESDVTKQVMPVDTDGGKAMLVDMTGTDAKTGQKARLVGAIVPRSGRTWFYKLMGNEQVVAREKDAFTRFVQTAKYSQ
jgi:hypothetical protein